VWSWPTQVDHYLMVANCWPRLTFKLGIKNCPTVLLVTFERKPSLRVSHYKEALLLTNIRLA